MPFVGQAKGKGVYGRYHSVHSNFATLKLSTGDNCNETSAWVYYTQRFIALINNKT